MLPWKIRGRCSVFPVRGGGGAMFKGNGILVVVVAVSVVTVSGMVGWGTTLRLVVSCRNSGVLVALIKIVFLGWLLLWTDRRLVSCSDRLFSFSDMLLSVSLCSVGLGVFRWLFVISGLARNSCAALLVESCFSVARVVAVAVGRLGSVVGASLSSVIVILQVVVVLGGVFVFTGASCVLTRMAPVSGVLLSVMGLSLIVVWLTVTLSAGIICRASIVPLVVILCGMFVSGSATCVGRVVRNRAGVAGVAYSLSVGSPIGFRGALMVILASNRFMWCSLCRGPMFVVVTRGLLVTCRVIVCDS